MNDTAWGCQSEYSVRCINLEADLLLPNAFYVIIYVIYFARLTVTDIGSEDGLQSSQFSAGNANPRGRVDAAKDIAGLAIYLCSRTGAYMVGDGGSVNTAR